MILLSEIAWQWVGLGFVALLVLDAYLLYRVLISDWAWVKNRKSKKRR